MKWHIFILYISISVAVYAAPLNLLKESNVTKPTDDPFYTPKPGFENLTNGDVIDYREVYHPFGFVSFSAKIKAVYQFLVRSEDSQGNPNAIVTTLYIPFNADPNKLVSYQTAEDSNYVNCAPSYAMQIGSDPNSWITPQLEQLLSEAGLYEGYYVVVPDHNGPKSAWLVGLQAAHACLDSLKAVLNSGDLTGLNSDARVVLWGYSGGTQPSTWAPAIAPSYAPNINLVGSAVGGIVADPLSIANLINGGFYAGFIVIMLNSYASEYPEFSAFLNETLYPEIQPAFYETKHRCLLGNLLPTIYTSWDDLSDQGAAIQQNPEFKKVFSENSLLQLNSTPSIPFFFYNGVHDEIVPANMTDVLYQKWCNAGVSIEYHQDRFSEHITESFFGAGEAFNWIKDRLNGKSQTGCSKKESASNVFSLSGITGSYELIADIIKTFEGATAGPNKPASSSTSSSQRPSNSSSATNSTSKSSSLLTSLLKAIF